MDFYPGLIHGFVCSTLLDHANITAQRIKSTSFSYRYLLVYTMPTVTSNNRKPIGLCMFLNCVSYLSIAYAWFYCKDNETKWENFNTLSNVYVVRCFFFFVSVLQKRIHFRRRYFLLDITTMVSIHTDWLTQGFWCVEFYSLQISDQCHPNLL